MNQSESKAMSERTNLLEKPPRGLKRPNPVRAPSETGTSRKQMKAEASVRNGVGSSAGNFSKGAVYKLHLHNFLTFDDVEIKPSPRLNVIVGPNGTGKSSIVCALCIGLGGPPKLLGRAKELKDFVKHGKDSGFVEIELYNPKGRNPVIKREISTESNSSTWSLNGRVVKNSDIKELVAQMNIKLDNHCQFLPQDMVVEFAKMNKYQLLEETEIAVGTKDMVEAHSKLKSLKSEHAKLQEQLRDRNLILEDEKRKNQLLERDVDRFKNREQHLTKVKHLRIKKSWVEYADAKEEHTTLRESKREVLARVNEIRRKYQPIKDQHKRQEDEVTRLKQVAQSSSQALRQAQRKVNAQQEKLRLLEDKLEEPKKELEDRKREEATKKKRNKDLHKEIETFKHALGELEPVESLQPKMVEKNSRMREIQKELLDIGAQQREVASEKQQHEDVIRHNEDELRKMQDVRRQRLSMIQHRDRNTYEAIAWLSKNKEMFREPILEPVMMSVNIKDPRYVNQVENFLGGKDFHSFVAQNEEDKEKFLKEVRDRLQLKINAVLAPQHPLSKYRPEIPMSTLQQYGFEKMMLDLIDAPQPVLRYFCQYHGLHQVPIAGKLRPEQIARIGKDLPKLRSFFTEESRISVKRSLYRNATSTRSGDIMPAQSLVASIDRQRVNQLKEEIKEAQQSLGSFNEHYEELQRRDRTLRQEDSKLRHEKNALKTASDQRKRLQANISSRQTKLDHFLSQDRLFDLKAAEEECEQKIDEIQQERVECLAEVKGMFKATIDALTKNTEDFLRIRTAEMRVGYLLQQSHQANKARDDAEQELIAIERQVQNAKQKALKLLDVARRVSGVKDLSVDPTLMKTCQALPQEVEKIDDMIHEYQAQADMCVGTDAVVVSEFEDRKRRISMLNDEIDSMNSELTGRNTRIEELKERWLTPLKILLSKINDRFRQFFSSHTQMDCAGEVSLEANDAEDFSKYGIQIRVKFRNSEELQALNAQRQSGGERSVSTMMYLLALQESAACPFRVVDEINQGMDPVNERHVFNLIVQAASEGAQYFLLTPKLLRNLEYSPAVQVHLVCNGQEMMPYSSWNLSSFLG